MFRVLSPFSLSMLFLLSMAPVAFGQSACPQPSGPPASDPLHTIISVHFDASTGDITVGSKTYCGQNPGFHLLALQRQPDNAHLDAPDLLWNQTYTDSQSVTTALTQILSMEGGPIVMVNAVGNYGMTLQDVAQGLKPFGAWPDLQNVNVTTPLIFIGNGGRQPQTALQRGGGTRPLDGYLAKDSTGNYAFTQTDFVRYDITTDGTIKVGNTTYTVADAVSKYGSCDAAASDSLHLVVVDRESPDVRYYDNAYCTRQDPTSFTTMANLLTSLIGSQGNTGNEALLVFIATNGHPIPADWNFGSDGDARIYGLATEMAQLGGYFETMVYLTPNDTYSIVGATPPPAGTPRPRGRARESSSIYPADQSGRTPTGELHGVLARGRGNWYSPLDADPTGLANLQLYTILAQAPQSFPSYDTTLNTTDPQGAAYQYINQNQCASVNCIRNQYGTLSANLNTVYTNLTTAKTATDPATGKDCDAGGNVNAGVPYCQVRAQLQTEVAAAAGIAMFYQQITNLWAVSGTVTIFQQLSAFEAVKTSLPQAQPTASANSLAGPIANLFLGLASALPEIGPIFGVADLFFNFGTSLATDNNGNQTIDLSSTIGELEDQTSSQFTAQGAAMGTLFELIVQDWGKLNTLGSDLVTQNTPGSPWYWDFTQLSTIMQGAKSAITQAAYQNIMAAAYAIGSYTPEVALNCYGFGTDGYPPGQNPVWGQYPLYAQPRSFVIFDGDYTCGNAGNSAYVMPFAPPSAPVYIPYTYPTDSANPYSSDTHTGTILAAGGWLAISLQTSPKSSGGNAHYDPPDSSLVSNLFTPVSQGGVGVYRPAFFEGWPFPRVTCTNADFHGNSGGCDWGSGETLEPPPPPVGSISMQAAQIASNQTEVDVRLTLFNNGTVPANSINLTSISLRTLAGSGQATVLSPVVPIQVGRLVPGDSTTVILQLNVPLSVSKLSITEAGSVDLEQSQLVQFSQGQVLYPQR